MQRPSGISACRRELNSHDAAKPREDSQPLQRARRQVPFESKWARQQSIIPSRHPTRSLLRAGAALDAEDMAPPCHIQPAHCVGSSGFQSARRAAAFSAGPTALGQLSRRLERVAQATVASAEREAPDAGHQE